MLLLNIWFWLHLWLALIYIVKSILSDSDTTPTTYYVYGQSWRTWYLTKAQHCSKIEMGLAAQAPICHLLMANSRSVLPSSLLQLHSWIYWLNNMHLPSTFDSYSLCDLLELNVSILIWWLSGEAEDFCVKHHMCSINQCVGLFVDKEGMQPQSRVDYEAVAMEIARNFFPVKWKCSWQVLKAAHLTTYQALKSISSRVREKVYLPMSQILAYSVSLSTMQILANFLPSWTSNDLQKYPYHHMHQGVSLCLVWPYFLVH